MFRIRRRMFRALGLSAVLIAGLGASGSAWAQKPIKVTYLSPVELSHPFWGQIVSFLKAVAEDLKIELEVIEASENRFLLQNKGLKVIRKADHPDYLITSYFPTTSTAFIEAGKENNVGIFIFNANLSEEDEKKVGLPRQRYPNWIGHMYPDGTQAGFLLADLLLQQARTKKQGTEAIQVIALRGSEEVYSRDWREYGLKRRIGSTSDATIVGNVACDWSRDIAKQHAQTLLAENPNLRVIWAASDLMALGGADAVAAAGKAPGKDVVIGGVDWAPEALKAIADGKMNVSLGGHFMEAGWALILLHDYHHGIDFSSELGTQILTSMPAIDAGNIQQFMQKFGDQDWGKVDFKKFSKKLNPKLEKYDFSLDALLKS